MKKTVALSDLELLNFTQQETPTFGCDQSWYPSWWKRQSGCGPSTAANQFAYLANQIKELENLSQVKAPFEKNSFVNHMQTIWRYITPGMGGTNSTKKFVDGALEYFQAVNLELTPFVFDVSPIATRSKDENLEKAADFLQSGLKANCPIAFLNLDNGKVENLHRWHWVTIVQADFDKDKIFVTVSDEGVKKVLDFSLWFQTTTKEGGLVYFSK